MIDHLLGRPSAAYKRTQVFLVILFWAITLLTGNKNGPPLVRWFSKRFRARLTPWQVLAGTLTCLYAVKNADSILGLSAPEPLARLYSRDFYRATWIVTALDTGFATAMHVRPRWLREILSILFSGYYLLFANEADEKLRKYRAFCTVEMLRSTWEKTGSPLIRGATSYLRPKVQIKRRIILPRPPGSPYSKPVIGWLYFDGSEEELSFSRELILDLPGGGFVCMGPLHHEERIIRWTLKTGKPLLALEYSKAPEYPYPYALHECFDVYRLLHETKGSVIGMRQGEIRIVMSGDSAGANIGAALLIKVLEMPPANRLPLPLSVIWTYPALDFNFTSFMPPEHLRILRHESSATIRGIADQKDHLKHSAPLSVVEDPPQRHRRRKSWSKSFSRLPTVLVNSLKSPHQTPKKLPTARVLNDGKEGILRSPGQMETPVDTGTEADNDGEGEEYFPRSESEKAISDRVQYWNPDRGYAELDAVAASPAVGKNGSRMSVLGTRLTMTSRTGFFNDRIISPSMMRAMAICYVGPRNSPDLSKNYYISPILTPSALLAQFPPVYLLCGERDPFSDDTLIFSGRLRDAKLAKKAELLAKLNKHGEGLRMSSATQATRDPILDETEDDWVTTRFIEGWSHGFMQMVALLPKVEHFFALTADWISYSFTKHEVLSCTPPVANVCSTASATRPLQSASLEAGSASEREDEPLTFVPKRRGSRVGSPAAAANIRSQLQQNKISSPSLGSSSASNSDTNSAPTSTAPTSMDEGSAKSRRPSPSEPAVKHAGDPIRRVLQEEADLLPQSGRLSPTVLPGKNEPSSGTGTPRKRSDAHENAVASTTFVEASDLIKRRREDAVYNLGSALVTSDHEQDLDNEPGTKAL